MTTSHTRWLWLITNWVKFLKLWLYTIFLYTMSLFTVFNSISCWGLWLHAYCQAGGKKTVQLLSKHPSQFKGPLLLQFWSTELIVQMKFVLCSFCKLDKLFAQLLKPVEVLVFLGPSLHVLSMGRCPLIPATTLVCAMISCSCRAAVAPG